MVTPNLETATNFLKIFFKTTYGRKLIFNVLDVFARKLQEDALTLGFKSKTKLRKVLSQAVGELYKAMSFMSFDSLQGNKKLDSFLFEVINSGYEKAGDLLKAICEALPEEFEEVKINILTATNHLYFAERLKKKYRIHNLE